nr:hypothetical protein BaRGS_014311 [Batillaria attramentaria]KAG5686537.1 hypothetical protein BaRGS_001538 [Batillaria attramentaria]
MVQQHENAALAELEKIGDRAERSYAAEISSLSDKLAGLSAIEYHLDTILAYESQTEVVVFEQYAADSVGQKGYLQKFTSRIHANGTIHIHTKRQEPAGLTHTDSLSKVIGSAIGFPRLN